jgi:ribonucleoside-diphosphate reductase alpha chain
MAKEGSTIGGLMDCFGTAVSMSLQYGVPLEVYVNKFSHTRFEPWGYTKNPDIKIAKSLVDYIFRWMGITFLPGYGEMNKAVPVSPAESGHPQGGPALAAGGEIEPETRPAATKAGGLTSGNGTSKQQPSATSVAQAQSAIGSQISNGGTSPNGNGNGSHASNGANGSNGNGNGHAAAVAKKPATVAARFAGSSDPQAALVARHEQFASFQADAPSCDRCGAITARAGNCYLCYNCGNSMGCS